MTKSKLEDGKFMTIDKDNGKKLIISYSQKRANKDKHNRERGLKRLEKQIKSGRLTKSNINNRGYNKYLQMDGEIKISIDYKKYEDDAKWNGLKGYLTRILRDFYFYNLLLFEDTQVTSACENLFRLKIECPQITGILCLSSILIIL